MAYHDIIGLFGVITILAAYFFLQLQKLSSHGITFSLCNLVGAIMILFSLYFDRNLSSIVIEFAWVLISIIGIMRWVKQRRRGSS